MSDKHYPLLTIKRNPKYSEEEVAKRPLAMHYLFEFDGMDIGHVVRSVRLDMGIGTPNIATLELIAHVDIDSVAFIGYKAKMETLDTVDSKLLSSQVRTALAKTP